MPIRPPTPTMAMIQPVLGPDDSDAGTALGDGAADVDAGSGVADEVVGEGEGVDGVGVGVGDGEGDSAT